MIILQKFSIPTKLSEITLGQWLKISHIIQDGNNNWIQKYFQILEILEVPDSVLDLITDAELFEWVAIFNKNDAASIATRKSITIDGEVFIGYEGDEFKLKARDVLHMEAEISEDADLSRIVAIMLKSTNPEIKSHYSNEEITRKAKLFNNSIASFFIPYLMYATTGLINKINIANDKSIAK